MDEYLENSTQNVLLCAMGPDDRIHLLTRGGPYDDPAYKPAEEAKSIWRDYIAEQLPMNNASPLDYIFNLMHIIKEMDIKEIGKIENTEVIVITTVRSPRYIPHPTKGKRYLSIPEELSAPDDNPGRSEYREIVRQEATFENQPGPEGVLPISVTVIHTEDTLRLKDEYEKNYKFGENYYLEEPYKVIVNATGGKYQKIQINKSMLIDLRK